MTTAIVGDTKYGCAGEIPSTGPMREILVRHASRFRLAIMTSDPASRLSTLREFPHGACRDASLLLAKYLQVNNCGRSLYVLGERHGHWHAWLQLLEFTVDITADQFEDQDEGVIVSSESPWHCSFDGKIYNVADFCLYDHRSAFELTRAYETLAGHADQAGRTRQFQ